MTHLKIAQNTKYHSKGEQVTSWGLCTYNTSFEDVLCDFSDSLCTNSLVDNFFNSKNKEWILTLGDERLGTQACQLTHKSRVQVFEMDAEVEEMTRDRRNNILIHGLPVQVTQGCSHLEFKAAS